MKPIKDLRIRNFVPGSATSGNQHDVVFLWIAERIVGNNLHPLGTQYLPSPLGNHGNRECIFWCAEHLDWAEEVENLKTLKGYSCDSKWGCLHGSNNI